MFIQITNTKLKRNNSVRTTRAGLFKMLKSKGWKTEDCTFKELPADQVKSNYASPDGKNTITTQR